MVEALEYGQEEDLLATYHLGKDLAGSSEEEHAGGCLAIPGTMLSLTIYLMLELHIHIHTILLTIGGES